MSCRRSRCADSRPRGAAPHGPRRDHRRRGPSRRTSPHRRHDVGGGSPCPGRAQRRFPCCSSHSRCCCSRFGDRLPHSRRRGGGSKEASAPVELAAAGVDPVDPPRQPTLSITPSRRWRLAPVAFNRPVRGGSSAERLRRCVCGTPPPPRRCLRRAAPSGSFARLLSYSRRSVWPKWRRGSVADVPGLAQRAPAR